MADRVGRGIDREVGEPERVVDGDRAQDIGQAAEEADVHRVLAGLAVDVERTVGVVASTNVVSSPVPVKRSVGAGMNAGLSSVPSTVNVLPPAPPIHGQAGNAAVSV